MMYLSYSCFDNCHPSLATSSFILIFEILLQGDRSQFYAGASENYPVSGRCTVFPTRINSFQGFIKFLMALINRH